MPVYKIVGGPHDGDFADVAPGVKDVQLKHPPSGPVDDSLFTSGETTMTEVITYTLRSINVGRHVGHHWEDVPVIKFLAPADWSDVKAIQHQFSK